ncbi:hypothetical protein ACI8AV_07115 [Geodermatophilus sp. SYSU D00804]
MSEPTWNEGQLDASETIEAADGTGYTSYSEFVSGDNGYEQDYPSFDSDVGDSSDVGDVG